jgi:hypothetical protein
MMTIFFKTLHIRIKKNILVDSIFNSFYSLDDRDKQ